MRVRLFYIWQWLDEKHETRSLVTRVAATNDDDARIIAGNHGDINSSRYCDYWVEDKGEILVSGH